MKIREIQHHLNGMIEAFGTHEECLHNSKTYARMVELQSLEEELEGR